MSLWPMCWSLKILAEKSTDLCQIRHFCNSMCLMMISQVNPSSPIDTWSNKWKARNFSPNNIYKNMIGQSEACFLFKWLRKCASRIRHKIFFWVAIHDIINTRGCSKVDPSRWKLMLDCYGMNLASPLGLYLCSILLGVYCPQTDTEAFLSLMKWCFCIKLFPR